MADMFCITHNMARIYESYKSELRHHLYVKTQHRRASLSMPLNQTLKSLILYDVQYYMGMI